MGAENDNDDTATAYGLAHGGRDLLHHLRDLRDAVGSLSGARMAREAQRLGLAIGRNTIYDLLAILDGRTTGWPEFTSVAAIVRICLDVARKQGASLKPEWRDEAWWEELQARRPARNRSGRTAELIGRIPPLATAFQQRDWDAKVGIAAEAGETVVLSGMGGVGKTQLAAHFADQAYRAGTVDLLVWVDASTRQGILDQYRIGAHIVDIPNDDQLTTDQVAERFLTWLRGTRRRWLIVLDDLTDPNHLSGLWPPAVPSGTVLVATRRADVVLHEQSRRVLHIGVYSSEEANQYLVKALVTAGSTPPHVLANDVAGVTGDLGGLPLALSHAAAYMKDNYLPCSHYRTLFAQRRNLAAVLPDESDAIPDEYRRTVAATLSLSIEAADALRPQGMAGRLLELAAVLDGTGGIPLDLFHAARHCLATVPDSHVIDAGLHCLRRLNLITVDRHARTVRVHNLVQAITRDRHPDNVFGAAYAAVDTLTTIWPDVESDKDPILRANTTSVLQYLLKEDHRSRDLRARAARSRSEAGDAAGAMVAYEQVLAEQLRELGSDHLDTLSTRLGIAGCRGAAGDRAGAVAALTQLRADMQRVLGPNHPDSLRTSVRLAFSRGQAGDHAGAMEALEQLLADELRVLGPDHPATLEARASLAHLQLMTGGGARAMADVEQLLADGLRVHGPDHPGTLAARLGLAVARATEGDHAGAMADLERLLADRLRVHGPDHQETLGTRMGLVYLRGVAGDHVGAVVDFEQLLADRIRIFGPDHPGTLTTRLGLAATRRNAGDHAGAIADLVQLLADQARVLGPDHPDTLTTRVHLALTRENAGDHAGAMADYEQLLADRLRVLGPDHPHTLNARMILTVLRRAAGDHARAVADFEQLLVDMLRELGPDHPYTLATKNDLAIWREEDKAEDSSAK